LGSAVLVVKGQWDVPGGGQWNCPAVANRTARRWPGVLPAGQMVSGLTPLPVVAWVRRMLSPAVYRREPLDQLIHSLVGYRTNNLINDFWLQNIRDALENGDSQLAARIVHTVKGVGGNLGATDLCAAALALEEAMKGVTAEVLQSSLAAFELKLSQVLESIRAMEETGVEAASEPGESLPVETPLDRERIATLSRVLAALLEANNMNALGVWEQLKPLLSGVDRDKLDAAVNSLNFQNAASLLKDVAKAMKIPL